MSAMRQIFLDTETTGLSPEAGDRIVEIGCIEMVSRRLTGETKHFYLNPERKGNEEAIKVHGLTDAFLADKPLFASVADELIEWLRGAEIVIHNAAFDVGFLNAELKRLKRPMFHTVAAKVTDTLLMVEGNKLAIVTEVLGIARQRVMQSCFRLGHIPELPAFSKHDRQPATITTEQMR